MKTKAIHVIVFLLNREALPSIEVIMPGPTGHKVPGNLELALIVNNFSYYLPCIPACLKTVRLHESRSPNHPVLSGPLGPLTWLMGHCHNPFLLPPPPFLRVYSRWSVLRSCNVIIVREWKDEKQSQVVTQLHSPSHIRLYKVGDKTYKGYKYIDALILMLDTTATCI